MRPGGVQIAVVGLRPRTRQSPSRESLPPARQEPIPLQTSRLEPVLHACRSYRTNGSRRTPVARKKAQAQRRAKLAFGCDTPAGSSRSPVSASEQQRLGSRARYFGPVRHARGHVACVRCHNLEFLHHCGVRPPSTATSRRHAVIGTDACVRVVQCDDQHGRRWHCAP